MAVAGAFDCFPEITREQYFSTDNKGISYIENLCRYGSSAKTIIQSSSNTLFGDIGGFELVKPTPAPCMEWPKLEKLNKEKEVIGIYLSSHPLDDYQLEIENFATNTLAELQNLNDYVNKDVVVAGMVVEAKKDLLTKNGKPWGYFVLQDYTDSFRFTLFDKEYIDNSKYFGNGYFLLISGKIQNRRFRENELEFSIKNINLLTSVKDELIKTVTININVSDLSRDFLEDLAKYVKANPGPTQLQFLFKDPANKITPLPMFSRAARIKVNNEFPELMDVYPHISFKVN